MNVNFSRDEAIIQFSTPVEAGIAFICSNYNNDSSVRFSSCPEELRSPSFCDIQFAVSCDCRANEIKEKLMEWLWPSGPPEDEGLKLFRDGNELSADNHICPNDKENDKIGALVFVLSKSQQKRRKKARSKKVGQTMVKWDNALLVSSERTLDEASSRLNQEITTINDNAIELGSLADTVAEVDVTAKGDPNGVLPVGLAKKLRRWVEQCTFARHIVSSPGKPLGLELSDMYSFQSDGMSIRKCRGITRLSFRVVGREEIQAWRSAVDVAKSFLQKSEEQQEKIAGQEKK